MVESFVTPPNAVLLLQDGTVFEGYGVGAEGTVSGEICFNTAMTGYQEVLTDPSYLGQIITFTFPHVGNVGVNGEDIESKEPCVGACGAILRENITAASSFRANEGFDAWLKRRGITGICGIDTRALTRHIRDHGAQNCAIAFEEAKGQRPEVSDGLLKKARAALEQAPDMSGLELAAHVTTAESYAWGEKRWQLEAGYTENTGPWPLASGPYHVVALDFGEKLNILRCLADLGCRVTVVPATTTAEEILALNPNGVFLSNGPGDPAATGQYAVPTIKKLVASGLPVFGICLGHQLLGLALGAKTEKMKRGHRGANHPVKDLATGKVEITSQNHGFCVREDNLPEGVEVTHRSLFDGSVEGIALKGKPVFSVQYHPESSPGPHDSHYLFERFVAAMEKSATHNGKAA